MNEVIAAGVLVHDGSVLLGKRTAHRVQWPDVWDAIGGHVEEGETPEAALVREFNEELGVVPTDFRRLETFQITQGTRDHTVTCHFFCVTAWDGEPDNRQPEEHLQIAWLLLSQVNELDVADRERTLRLLASIEEDPVHR
jgi:8-oxo-dGTP diphosphatase